MKRIYIFSGLGADERVFKYLTFPGYEPVFMKWLEPLTDETIKQYAKRLCEKIPDPRPVLLGLSFGGIIASEIAKLTNAEKVIIIASVKTRKEIPFYFRGGLNLHKLMPANILKHPGFIANWFFGVQTTEDKKLLADILRDTDPTFLKWAIDQIVKWKNQTKVLHIQHIHGTADRIFPYRFVSPDYTIVNGGHFMTVNKSGEMNAVLKELLEL